LVVPDGPGGSLEDEIHWRAEAGETFSEQELCRMLLHVVRERKAEREREREREREKEGACVCGCECE
jgi:hypothetical protein